MRAPRQNNMRPLISSLLLLTGLAFGQTGFSIDALDRSVNPCDDFYRFSCGTWLKNNPIPPDQSSWGRFNELAERNRTILREILEKYSPPTVHRDANEQKIGDYYASCMDEGQIDAKGLGVLQPELKRIAGLRGKSGIGTLLAYLHSIGVNAGFAFSAGQDFKDAKQMIAQADQAGMGLPDRDYYLRTDSKSETLRKEYTAHVARVFVLAGEPEANAQADAAAVMRLETALAKGALDRVSRRDPEKIYHKMTTGQLRALAPDFDWTEYLAGTHAPAIQSLNVSEPEFLRAMNTQLIAAPLDEWKAYFRWHLLRSSTPMLPVAFVNEDFSFYGKTLRGITELQPRWKRCVASTNSALSDALGKKYVERTFGVEGKRRTLQMVEHLEAAMAVDLNQLTWMTPQTKKQALLKLKAITNKIGYPDKWRDYSSLTITRGQALANMQRASTFEFHRDLNKIGQPVDPNEWFMTPPTVNAYYDPQMNNINFPAGILQPPFYSNKMDDAVNFGGIGAVIGHELTHGFDDEGRQFDAHGNLRDWWTPKDASEFSKRTECLVKEYSNFEPLPGVKVNGKLTLGENTADNGGVRIALMALMTMPGTAKATAIDGFTPVQRFFLAWGQIWCNNMRDQMMRLLVSTDPHSPAKYRVNGVVQNMPEFQNAFGCKAGQPMVSPKACRVW